MRYHFADVLVDTAARLVRRSDQPAHLSPKAFDLLQTRASADHRLASPPEWIAASPLVCGKRARIDSIRTRSARRENSSTGEYPRAQARYSVMASAAPVMAKF